MNRSRPQKARTAHRDAGNRVRPTQGRVAGLLALMLWAILALGPGIGSSGPAQAQPRVEHVGTYIWRDSRPGFGGWSGLWMAPDGASLIAVTDQGHIGRAQVRRNAQGQITGISLTAFEPLRNARGERLRGYAADAESVTVAPGGEILVGFEIVDRVVAYDRIGGPGRELPRPPAFRNLIPNEGIEAIAVDTAGTIYAIPEQTIMPGADFRVFRFRDGRWTQPFRIPREGRFLPVGAEFGPDGWLYLLERDFRGALGFRNRVRRFRIEGDSITAQQRIFETRDARHTNLEGLGVWRDSDGWIRLTMIADNNFRRFLPNEVVEYRFRP